MAILHCRLCATRAPFVALLSLSTICTGLAGCDPSDAVARSPSKQTPLPAAHLKTQRKGNPSALEPFARRAQNALPDYVLPFEARSNPFAPPKPAPGDRSASPGTLETVDVELVGIMSDDASSMAVIKVAGEQRVVFPGTRLDSPSTTDPLRIVKIREVDIVVEQGGRQWIVLLPQP